MKNASLLFFLLSVMVLGAGCRTATSLNPSNMGTNTAPTPSPANEQAQPAANMNTPASSTTAVVADPINNFFGRVTKKPFGIYITPKTSPIQPEKFTGYHTGADAETTATEANVPIFSIAAGIVVFAGHVNGYGGVMMIQSTVTSEVITTLYGHLRISSFTKKKNETVKIGQQIAVLGTGYSAETDGERQHLHLGIIKGTHINYKGYVPNKSQLSAWQDPVAWLKAHGAIEKK